MSSLRTVLTIGSFDGVHLGHRAILARARAIADEQGARVIALTFDPHPMRILRPEAEPPLLCSIATRVRRLQAAGAHEVVVLEPTRELLGHTAEQFMADLVKRYHPLAIVEGPDFRFGKGRAGDLALLRTLGERAGFAVHVLDRVEVPIGQSAAVGVSSTLVRWLVGQGRVRDAALALGAHFELTAPVIQGAQFGRTIGVPTANLDPHALRDHMVPADGVYAGSALLPDGRTFAAALSVGVKPTFGEQPLAIEAHLLEFEENLYNHSVTLRFARWLRDQTAFPGIDLLQRQLTRDIDRTRSWHRRGLLEAPVAPQPAARRRA